MFAFISVGCLYQYFGFFVHSFWGGYIIGFKTALDLENCIIISLLLSIAMICIRFTDWHHIFNIFIEDKQTKNNLLYQSIKYFEIPLIIMSNIVLFLGLLINLFQ